MAIVSIEIGTAHLLEGGKIGWKMEKGLINAWKFEVINYEMKKVLFRNEPLPCFEA